MVIGHLTGGVKIARVEIRRSVRNTTGRLSQLLGIAFGLFVFCAGALLGAYVLIQTRPDLSGIAVGETVRSIITFQWLFVTAILIQRVVTLNSRPDVGDLLFTTVRPTTVVLGVILAEVGRVVAYISPAIIILTVALAYVTGTPATVPLVLLAGVLLVASAAVLAHLLGFGIKLAVARIPVLARHRTTIGAFAVIAFFAGYTVLQSSGGATRGLGLVPIGWLGDTAALALPVTASPLHAVGGVVATGAVVAVGVPLATRVATLFWFGDSVTPEIDTEAATVEGVGTDPLASGLGLLGRLPLGDGQSGAVARRVVLLARRAPAKLSYLILPVAIVGSLTIQAAVGTLTLPQAAFAPGLGLFLVWTAGAAFTLNPLGDEGRVLPLTLTSPIAGRTYIRGLTRPGITLGLAVVPLVPALALTTTYGPVEAGLLTLATVVGIVAATVGSTGIGMLFPRTDAVRVARGREATPPTVFAMVLYSIGVGVTVALPMAAALAPEMTRAVAAAVFGVLFAVPFALVGGPLVAVADAFRAIGEAVSGLDATLVQWGGFVVPLLVGLVVGAVSARFAARYVESYTL